MNLFLKILSVVAIILSFVYLIFYRTGVVDSAVIASTLLVSSFMVGADIFYSRGFDDGYDHGTNM